MRVSLMLGIAALGVLLVGCAAQPTSDPQQQASSVASTAGPDSTSSGTGLQPMQTIVNANNVENYIKHYDAFADSIKVPHSEYEDEGKAFLGIVKQINNLLNVELTEEEIAASETLKTEDGKVGPEALAAMKRDAYNELLPDAAFKGQLDKISESNFKYWMQTRNDPNPFKTEFVRTGMEINVFKYINNAGQGNSLKPIANADIFRFYAVDPTLAGSKLGESSSTDEKTYTLNPGTKLVKEGSTANQR